MTARELSGSAGESIHYRRNRFSTRLPADRLYTGAHFWLREDSPGVLRVGLTKFATRMLGEIVELDFEIEMDHAVRLAEVVGWIEGFKAVSDLYCVAEGRFLGPNQAALEDPASISSRPYSDGWLYAVEGRPDPAALDVDGYVKHLDRTIDAMLDEPWKTPRIGSA